MVNGLLLLVVKADSIYVLYISRIINAIDLVINVISMLKFTYLYKAKFLR